MEEARKLVVQGRDYVVNMIDANDTLKQVQDQALVATRELARTARLEVARMEAATAEQVQEAKSAAQWLKQEATKYEAQFFDNLKEGVFYAAAHKTETVLLGTTVLVLCLPATHRFLYRRTFGRFRTPEGMVQAAEKRLEDLKQSSEMLRNDSSKLQERAQMAEQEFTSGRTKLRATAAELRRLHNTLQREEGKAQGLRELLKELPARDSVRLRSELANAAHELRQQAVVLDRRALKISRLGIEV